MILAKQKNVQVGVSVIVLAVIAVLYAIQIGDHARSSLFRGFVSSLKQTGCELQRVDYDSRTIDVMDFTKSNLSAAQLEYRLGKFKAYKATSLIVPAKWTSYEVDCLRETTAEMVESIKKG